MEGWKEGNKQMEGWKEGWKDARIEGKTEGWKSGSTSSQPCAPKGPADDGKRSSAMDVASDVASRRED